MAKQKANYDGTTGSAIPDIHFILVNNNGRLEVVNLDEYGKEETDILMSIYEREIERHGEHNVRMCRVISARVKKSIEFIE